MRQIILDTETTGLNPKQGERIIEIGCVEMINRRLTGNHYHQYIQPNKQIDPEAINVHGITNEFLQDKPVFPDIVEAFIEYVKGAELIIHNAPFDVGFLNHEFKLVNQSLGKIEDYCSILDTLVLARKKHPGQRNSLDALCKRYSIDNSHRELHGALLDSEILAQVYLAMTSGQASLAFDVEQTGSNKRTKTQAHDKIVPQKQRQLVNIQLNDEQLSRHQSYLESIKVQSGQCVWLEEK